MTELDFRSGGASILQLRVNGDRLERLSGDDDWLDYDYRPTSPTTGMPVSVAESPRAWAEALAAEYRSIGADVDLRIVDAPPTASKRIVIDAEEPEVQLSEAELRQREEHARQIQAATGGTVALSWEDGSTTTVSPDPGYELTPNSPSSADAKGDAGLNLGLSAILAVLGFIYVPLVLMPGWIEYRASKISALDMTSLNAAAGGGTSIVLDIGAWGIVVGVVVLMLGVVGLFYTTRPDVIAVIGKMGAAMAGIVAAGLVLTLFSDLEVAIMFWLAGLNTVAVFAVAITLRWRN